MDNRKKENLAKAGVDVEDGIARVLGNEELYEKLLGKFLKNESLQAAKTEIGRGDLGSARKHLHTLKGLAANLGMERLRAESAEAESALKNGREPENMESLQKSYQDIVEILVKE
ncbi:MAG TPA: histidine kinase [Clostridiales bacterium]|nr:histidine kinase [Clostridiales bacterium]